MSEKAKRPPPALSRGIARGWRSLSGMGSTELVPQARLSGPMPWVIAIMVALTVIAAAAGFALRNIADAASAELAGGVTVQILEAAPELRARQASDALAALQGRPEVESVRQVPQDELDALVEPWLGASVGDDDLPVPALVDVRLRGKVDAAALKRIADAVRPVAPSSRVDAQSSWLVPVFGAIGSLQWLALALIALLMLSLAAAVLLAVRNALASARETIEIVHLLGGTDKQIARVFQRSIAFDATGGGTIGLALGLVAILFLGRQFAALDSGMVTGGTLHGFDWVMLALIPVAGIVLAAFTARIAVLRALRKML